MAVFLRGKIGSYKVCVTISVAFVTNVFPIYQIVFLLRLSFSRNLFTDLRETALLTARPWGILTI